jgi:hypothetical protein
MRSGDPGPHRPPSRQSGPDSSRYKNHATSRARLKARLLYGWAFSALRFSAIASLGRSLYRLRLRGRFITIQ